jgi:hypothetical protein
MYTPPGVPRSRSFTRFTMRVGLEHFGQSVLLLVSITFLRSPVLAIFAIMLALPNTNVAAHALDVRSAPRWRTESKHPELLVWIDRDSSTAKIRKRRTAIEALLQVYTTTAVAWAALDLIQGDSPDWSRNSLPGLSLVLFPVLLPALHQVLPWNLSQAHYRHSEALESVQP